MLLLVVVVAALLGLAIRPLRTANQNSVALAQFEALGYSVKLGDDASALSLWLNKHLTNIEFRKVVGLSGAHAMGGSAPLSHLKAFAQLEYLNLWRKDVTDGELVYLEGLTELRTLIMGETKVGDAGLAHLRGLKKLEYLSLGDTKVTDAGLAHLERLTQLTHLNVTGTQVTDAGVEALQRALPNCRIKR